MSDDSSLAIVKEELSNMPENTIGFDTLRGFELLQRVGNVFAKSSFVPKEFQGNLANCCIALNLAAKLKMEPLILMQNIYIVHGRPGFSAQFLISTFNVNKKFSPLRYKFEGNPGTDEWGCRAWSIEKETGEKLEGTLITVKLAKTEGWYDKNGSKWKTMPEQMLRYRAAAFFIRAYAPEISMGFYTVEELEDFVHPIKEINAVVEDKNEVPAKIMANRLEEKLNDPFIKEVQEKMNGEMVEK